MPPSVISTEIFPVPVYFTYALSHLEEIKTSNQAHPVFYNLTNEPKDIAIFTLKLSFF